jgi:hypothetical protein
MLSSSSRYPGGGATAPPMAHPCTCTVMGLISQSTQRSSVKIGLFRDTDKDIARTMKLAKTITVRFPECECRTVRGQHLFDGARYVGCLLLHYECDSFQAHKLYILVPLLMTTLSKPTKAVLWGFRTIRIKLESMPWPNDITCFCISSSVSGTAMSVPIPQIC